MHHDFQSEAVKGLKRKASLESSEFEHDVKLKKNKHCRASKAKWTSEEDEALTRAVVINGEGNWKKIAQSLNNDRSHLQCLHRWQKVLNPALVKGPWKEEEDAKLVELVEQYGAKDWSSIASHIPGRIGKQCRERWFNHLSPEVRKTNWSPEEDRIIIESHHRLGNKWTAISKLLDGRPANAIKNHWNSTLLKRIQDENGESPIRRERKKVKNIFNTVQATDDSDGSESISSDCSSPEDSPRAYSAPIVSMPGSQQHSYILPTHFMPQSVSESPVPFMPLTPSPRIHPSALMSSFAPFGDGGAAAASGMSWDWPSSQQHAASIGVISMGPITNITPGVYIDTHTPTNTNDTYSFPAQSIPELSYCLSSNASDIHSSNDTITSSDEDGRSSFYNCGEMEMPSLFTV